MNKVLLSIALMSCVTIAHATNNGNGNNGSNNGPETTNIYNQPGAHATGGAGGAGGKGGDATSIAGASSVAEAKANAAALSNASATQGQAQGQQQAAIAAQQQSNTNKVDASSKNTNQNEVTNKVEITDNSSYEAQKRDPVATAYAASIAPTAPCMGSTSGGVQTVGFGFSVGGTWTDDNCVLLEQVRAVKNVGEVEVAIEMLNEIPAYKAAKQRIADRKAQAAVGK